MVLLEKLVNETTKLLMRVKREALTGNASGIIYTRFLQLFGECMMGNLNGLLFNSQNGGILRCVVEMIVVVHVHENQPVVNNH